MRLNLTEGYYDHLENALKGETVYIVGSGPSLIGYDYGRLKGKTVIAVNHAFRELEEYKLEPRFHVFLDQRFLQESGLDIENLPYNSISSSNSTMSPRVKDKGGLSVIKASNTFSLDPRDGFFSPRNSIAFAISCALFMGVSEINLLGADCRVADKKQAALIAQFNGNDKLRDDILNDKFRKDYFIHSTSGKYKHTKDELKHAQIFEVMQSLFLGFDGKTTVPIYNCSHISKIPNFPKKDLP